MEGNCSTGLAAPLARRITTRRFATSVPLAGRGLKPLSVLVEATRVPGNRDTEKACTCSGKRIFRNRSEDMSDMRGARGRAVLARK